MLFAAGLGTRMAPLTADRPKPLICVAGRPLIDHALDQAVGIDRIVVNLHYRAGMIRDHLRGRANIAFSDETDTLLETGGGLMHARDLIDADPFLCVNSDNLWVDGPVNALRLMAGRWDDRQMDALLLLVPQARANNHPGKGDFHMDAMGRLSRRKPNRVAPFVFTGIQMMSKRLLVDAPEGPFSTNLFWNRAIAAGRCYGVVHQGMWFDVGSPAAIPVTEAMLADG
jgi:MurNAc alpha-1-phosphate uridylyltransferase